MEYITGIITLQAIFSIHWTAYCNWYKGTIREAVLENVRKILKCRTFRLGYHMYRCPNCSSVRLIPHSCKSRFCSSCGKIATDKWTEERLSDVLAVGYHHLVFTIPWQLRAIILLNREIVLNILEVGLSIKHIGRYTKKSVIAETRIIRCDNRWVIFKFKDYADGGKSSIKKMGLFTFIAYLTHHNPDKYFRVVRPYGLFSCRLKGELLPQARQALNQTAKTEKALIPDWRKFDDIV